MKKDLKEIIEEIQNLDNDMICEKININYRKWKEGELTEKKLFLEEGQTIEDFVKEVAEEAKKIAIKDITHRYQDLDDSYAKISDEDYEAAYLKVFERRFGIVKDEEKIKEIDKKYMKDLRWLLEGLFPPII